MSKAAVYINCTINSIDSKLMKSQHREINLLCNDPATASRDPLAVTDGNVTAIMTLWGSCDEEKMANFSSRDDRAEYSQKWNSAAAAHSHRPLGTRALRALSAWRLIASKLGWNGGHFGLTCNPAILLDVEKC